LRSTRGTADERVTGFFTSLYLDYAHSLEQLGHIADARHCYELAARALTALPDDGYAALVRAGVAAGRARTGVDEPRT
jgi:hypothetical protein